LISFSDRPCSLAWLKPKVEDYILNGEYDLTQWIYIDKTSLSDRLRAYARLFLDSPGRKSDYKYDPNPMASGYHSPISIFTIAEPLPFPKEPLQATRIMWASQAITILFLSAVFRPHLSLAHPSNQRLSVRQTAPVPSTPNESIYIAPECTILMRMQKIENGQSALDARVVRLNWNDDSGTVTRTITNYNNAWGSNAQLWNKLNLKSLLYYGLVGARGTVTTSQLGALEHWGTENMVPQDDLMSNDDNPSTSFKHLIFIIVHKSFKEYSLIQTSYANPSRRHQRRLEPKGSRVAFHERV
jgi:hypothetical protein